MFGLLQFMHTLLDPAMKGRLVAVPSFLTTIADPANSPEDARLEVEHACQLIGTTRDVEEPSGDEPSFPSHSKSSYLTVAPAIATLVLSPFIRQWTPRELVYRAAVFATLDVLQTDIQDAADDADDDADDDDDDDASSTSRSRSRSRSRSKFGIGGSHEGVGADLDLAPDISRLLQSLAAPFVWRNIAVHGLLLRLAETMWPAVLLCASDLNITKRIIRGGVWVPMHTTGALVLFKKRKSTPAPAATRAACAPAWTLHWGGGFSYGQMKGTNTKRTGTGTGTGTGTRSRSRSRKPKRKRPHKPRKQASGGSAAGTIAASAMA